MKTMIMKSTWFFLCLLLFSYNAWRCLDQYLLFKTVTKFSQEEQQLHEFPMICLGPDKLAEERTAKLNMTPEAYQKGEIWRTEKISEEEVYNNLSTRFKELVKKIKIRKTKSRNSGANEELNVESEDLNTSEVHVTESDYYKNLRRTCFQFPSEMFPFGIQKIDFYMKNAQHVEFFVTSPGNAFTQDNKFNTFKYSKGMAEYGIEYTLRYSINMDKNPCSEEASWNQDNCTLGIINDKIMDTFNCTAPWLLSYARYLSKL